MGAPQVMRRPESRDRILDGVERWPPFGTVLEDVDIAATNTDFYHGLGRRYYGFLVIKNNVLTNVADVDQPATDKKIRLIAGSACTASIWVF